MLELKRGNREQVHTEMAEFIALPFDKVWICHCYVDLN